MARIFTSIPYHKSLPSGTEPGYHVSMPYQPILATLAYVMSPDRKQVLMIHRNTRPDDEHFGKYNGLGGKVDAQEDMLASVRREVREEAGIECIDIRLRGTISWPGFGKEGDGWFAFVFRIDKFEGTPFTSSPEGTLSWKPVDKISDLNLWDGDYHFLPMVFDDSEQIFHGLMPYRDGKLLSAHFVRS